jgi:RimJ/RimL family protein N-acetyltransferase
MGEIFMNERYKENLIAFLNRYKRKNPADPLVLVPILGMNNKLHGFLRPVTADFRETIPECVYLFSKWRRENPSLSPARFEVTDERTEGWLQRLVVDNDQRFLFMVQTPMGKNVGHIGFASFRYEEKAAEVDSVLKGEKSGNPRLMEYALASLVRWGKEALHLEHIDLEVLSDNQHAISFYQRCGFQDDALIPLEKIEADGEIKWRANEALAGKAKKYYLHMKLF